MYQCQKNKYNILAKILLTILFCGSISKANPVPTPLTPQIFEKDEQGTYVLRPSEKTAGRYQHGAVATSSKQCANVGAKILKKGGSAVDAAIATLLCDGVVSLQGLGIGGGFLMTIWDSNTQKAYFLNAREYAPAAAYETIFTPQNKDDATKGAKSIAVPGEVAGYWEAHQRFGKLPWADLFEDAIKICEEGSKVSRYVANDIRKIEADLKKPQFSSLKNILLSPTDSNSFVDAGEKIQRLKLANTLKKIRDNGKDIFYKGEIAKKLVKEIQSAGGIITLNDFKNYEAEWKEPVNTTIDGKIMYSAPTPGSGAILGFMMNILQKLIPASNEKVMWQRIAETFKWGYARRTELGDFTERSEYENKKAIVDCKISSENVEAYEKAGYTLIGHDSDKWDKDCLMSVSVKTLLDKKYADKVRALIKDNWTSNDYLHYNVTREGRVDLGTAHTSVYAADGSAVSVTSTINHIMGSLVRSESTGIILNNQMDDYSYPGIVSGFGIEPSEFNFVRKGSTLRPMSSMAPTIILNKDKTVRLVIGSAGGTKITTGIAQGIIFNLLLNKDIKYSIDHPRIHHNLWPMAVQVEPDFNKDVVKYLKNVGHDIDRWLIMQNTLSAIAVYGPNDIEASGDYRREGGTAGY